MDPFEVRMQFLSILRRLNASQQSIQKVVAYALKYFQRCGEDLWDCIFEECQKGSLNTRINILYLLDSLSEASLLSKAASSSTSNLYVDFVARDLATIVDYVVPQGREGLINLTSAVQILENWRTKRIIDPQKVEDVLNKLDAQKSLMHDAAAASASGQAVHAEGSEGGGGGGGASESLTFSRNEVFKRIEEDRERHKRLRERRWVQPVSHALGQGQGQGAFALASFAPMPMPMPPSATSSASASAPVNAGPATKAPTSAVTATVGPSTTAAPAQGQAPLPLALDIEFDNEWETTSDWNEDDDEAVQEENALCFPNAATRLAPAPAPAPSHPLAGPFDPSSSSAVVAAAHQRGGAQTEDPGSQIPKVRVKIDRERARTYAR